ncbi:MAG: hypothetical protein JOY63_09270 [Acetobacteraceae bacterium]|nr:hypothetical protein [Acetobacteraceae bacterium]
MSLLPFQVSLLRTMAACALAIGGAGACAGAAHAQSIGTPSMGMPGAAPSFGQEQLDRSVQGQRRPPAALPGVAPKEQPIAPPNRVPTLMSPTEALFDAVNRGDMAGARDAISRGADLGATNELGLTPLDLAIDLGRSDISFLLLSIRNAGIGTSGGQQQVAQATPAEKALEASGASARPRPGRRLATRVTVEPAGQPSLPRLFEGNGGEPIPSAGFLGFGGR